MAWWLWLLVGLVLTGLELMAAGGFYLIFFGLSALLIGVLELAGFGGAVWLQWLLFAVLSIVALVLFRNPLLRTLNQHQLPVDRIVGEIATPVADIPAGDVGRAELRGTSWTARNIYQAPLLKGQRCRVERVDGLMLFLLPE
jgi:membrane protein implicated in regulation of membrane protease activity